MYGACDQIERERDLQEESQRQRRIVQISQRVLVPGASFQIYGASQVFHGEYRRRPSNHHV